MLQCQKWLSGCMFDVDQNLKHKEEQALKFTSIEPVRKKKWHVKIEKIYTYKFLSLLTDSSASSI